MSIVMLICPTVAIAAIPTGLRYLPGRAAPDTIASPQPSLTASPPTGTPR
jgi:hypothetical protein